MLLDKVLVRKPTLLEGSLSLLYFLLAIGYSLFESLLVLLPFLLELCKFGIELGFSLGKRRHRLFILVSHFSQIVFNLLLLLKKDI